MIPGFSPRQAPDEPWPPGEERLRLAAEAAHFGIYDADLVAGTLYWSPQMLVILGLPPGTAPPPPRGFPVHLHPEDAEAARQAFRRAFDPAGDGQALGEHRLVRPDGAVRWVQLSGQVRFAGEGPGRRAIRFSGVVVDITPRKAAEQRLRADLDAMTRLHRLGTLFVREGNLEPVLGDIVEAAIAIAGADFGNIQLLDPATGELRVVAHQGLPQWWVDYWNSAGLGRGSCGAAWSSYDRVIVEDVALSPIFAGTPALEIQLRAGIRAVQSTPLVSRSGTPLGMFSTHYKIPHRPDERALRLLDLLARQAADIVERAQAEEALRVSEERLTLAYQAGGLGAFEWNVQTGVNTWTPRLEAMYGLAPGEFGRTQPAWEQRVHPDDRPAAVASVERALATGQTQSGEWRVVWPDGSVHWIAGRFQGFGEAGGGFQRLIGVNLDITERKRVEESLRQQRELLESVIRHMPAALCLIRGHDRRLLLINPAYQAIAPGKAMQGKTLDEVWPETGKDFAALCGKVLETGLSHEAEDELNMISRRPGDPPEAAYFSWSLHRIRLPGEEGWGLIAAAWETTARKQVEERLRESELFYRQTLDSIPGMVFTTRPDGWCDFQSPQWEDYTGVPLAQQLGGGWQTLLHPDDRARAIATWRIALGDQGPYDLEYRVRRRDGAHEWFRVIGRPIRDAAGKIVRWFGVAMNIQQLKEAEAALRQADRRKDEFLATLAHELRNPLAPISNAVAILQLEGAAESVAQAARDMIERQVRHMARLIDDLLDVSRIRRGTLQLRKQPLDLAAVLRQAVETAQPLVVARGHRLAVSLPPEPVRLEGDPLRLTQVFSNLLNNACTYTPRGGQLRLALHREGAQAVVAVQDSGVGIAAEDLPHIFEMFRQAAAPGRERPSSGLGIGLSLVRRMVAMHGGRVEARSEGVGKGSTFVVRLPAAGNSRPARAAPAEPGAAATPGAGRVLLADDNESIVASLAQFLRLSGVEVHTAEDGEAAVAAAERYRPDLVLLDLGMPRLDGYGACRRMREQPWGQPLTIVAMTGWGQDSDRRRTAAAGFDSHLVKPVAPSAILALLARLRSGQA